MSKEEILSKCSNPKRIRVHKKAITIVKKTLLDIFDKTYASVIVSFLSVITIYQTLVVINKQFKDVIEKDYVFNKIKKGLKKQFKFADSTRLFHIYTSYNLTAFTIKTNCWCAFLKNNVKKARVSKSNKKLKKYLKKIYNSSNSQLFQIAMTFPEDTIHFINKICQKSSIKIENLHMYSMRNPLDDGIEFFTYSKPFLGKNHILNHLWVSVNGFVNLKLLKKFYKKQAIKEYSRRLNIFKYFFFKIIARTGNPYKLWDNIEASIGYWVLKSEDEDDLQYLKSMIEFLFNDFKIYKFTPLTIQLKMTWASNHKPIQKQLEWIKKAIFPLDIMLPHEYIQEWKYEICCKHYNDNIKSFLYKLYKLK